MYPNDSRRSIICSFSPRKTSGDLAASYLSLLDKRLDSYDLRQGGRRPRAAAPRISDTPPDFIALGDFGRYALVYVRIAPRK